MTHLEIIGRVWSDWKVTQKLGEGSFGQVFKAEKERFGIMQESAIKVVRIPSDEAELKRVQTGFGLNEEELKEYFYPEVEKLKKEVVLMQELGQDSHVVRILDFEIIDAPDVSVGWYILIRMELLECLEDYIKRADIRVEDVISLGEDILTGLEICEEKNIIHRDIKPANIFRNDKGVYKLGDFGIARDMRAVRGSLSHKGTQNYMAPEVYMGRKYDSTIDIYALGIVLYKLLNKNRLPFMDEEKLTADSIERAFQKRNTGENFTKPLQASDALYEIIKKMCAYNPEERFKTATEVKKALAEYKINHSEELKEVLEIVRKTGSAKKITITQSQEKEQVKDKGDLEKIGIQDSNENSKNNLNAGFKEYNKRVSSIEDINQRMPDAGTVGQVQNIDENKYESSMGRTKSLYQEVSKNENTTQNLPSIEHILNEEAEKSPKKKSKVSLIIGIITGCFVLLAGSFIFIALNNKEDSYVVAETSETRSKKKNKNKETEAEAVQEIEAAQETDTETAVVEENTGEDIAREIAADDSIFEIDTEKYSEYSMEYTTTFSVDGEDQEVKGTYIGDIKFGTPNGYGLFYFTREVNTESGIAIHYVTYLGEWESGKLKTGSTVKRRLIAYDKNKLKAGKVTVMGEWGDNGFVEDVKGVYRVEKFNNSEEAWEILAKFEGTLKRDSYEPLNGDLYFNETGFIHRGDFQNWQLYNGTAYDENGNVMYTVVNGEKQND